MFSRSYDASLERLYAAPRALACEALDLRPGLSVLDLPTGTGQSLPALAAGVGPAGRVLGVDLSEGMLRRAQARVEAAGWSQVTLRRADVATLSLDAPVDRALVFLGLSTFPAWEAAFARVWDAVAPGGRVVVVDVFAERPGLRGHLVNLIARADIRRRTWEPLERGAADFRRVPLPQDARYGGEIFCATGRKP